MEKVVDKQKKTFDALKSDFSYSNVMQTPRIQKVVINVGMGKMRPDKRKSEVVAEKLAQITGQKVASRMAKKSIASFKVREGQLSGYQVTLRGKRMNDFLDKLLNIALPRTRDFRGIKTTGVDEMGNYSLGIIDNSIFPETADQDLKDAFGMTITVVTTSSNPKETLAYLKHLGFPFKKDEA